MLIFCLLNPANNFEWYWNKNIKKSIEQDAFQYAVCKMAFCLDIK